MIWTLRKKILIGYGITLAVAMVVFLWAFVNLLRLGHASDAILSENYRSILAAENMIDAIERQDSGTLLIITAYGTVESAVEAMKLGAVDFIQKPFSPGEIRELVSQVLDREKLEEQKALDYTAHIQLAKRCVADRQFDAAVEHARKAISLEHTRPEAFNLLGALMEIRRNVLEAHKYYRTALELDPTYKPAMDNLNRSTQWRRQGEIVLDQTVGKRKNKKEKTGKS